MKRKYGLVMAAIMTAVALGGCGSNDSAETGKGESFQSAVLDTESEERDNAEAFSQEAAGAQGSMEREAFSQDGAGNSPQSADSTDGQQTESGLEEELARYRQEREDNIQEANGLVEGGSPDESNYTFDLSGTGNLSQFDTRETTEGFAAARIYVTDTLGIKPETKMEIYMCVDPRILAIYEDEDKGVAAGYDSSDIFVCEYCGEGGVWQYLILVRDGKGSQWKVIHHGSSYKEQAEGDINADNDKI